MLTGALVSGEVLCLCAASFLWFQKSGSTFAESASYAVITVFMSLSFVHQISFITGSSIISTGMEIFLLILSVLTISRQRSGFSSIIITLKKFGSVNPVSFSFLGICILYMAIRAFYPIPEEFQKELYHIAFYEKKGFFPVGAASEYPALLPVNHLILFNTFLRFDSTAGAGIFCFLAYLSIGSSTYALARRYSWQTTAFTTVIMVMSMPRIVIQAIYPGTQIISVAVALFCILAMYRSVELPAAGDFALLILGLFFCISETVSSLIFTPVLFFLCGAVLFRRHGIAAWKTIVVKNRYTYFAIIPVFIFSQSWLFLSNYFNKQAWPGIFSDISLNLNGIQGAAANLIRYVFEGLNAAAPIELFYEKRFRWSMAENLQSLYDFSVRPFLGDSGAIQVFHLTWPTNGMLSFGPAAFFLVLPALFYALVKGPRRLKSVATALFFYFFMTSLIVAWAPGNAKFFEIFYVCSGFSIAFFLPPWRFTKSNKKILQAAGGALLLLTLLAAS